MPYRAINVVAGVLGVVVLVGLVVVGVNVYRAARTGPRWKRALITAGLVMLGVIGTVSCGTTCYVYYEVPPEEIYQRDRQGLKSVSDRMDALERQVADGDLEPWVVRHVLDGVETDLKTTADKEDLKGLTEAQQKELVGQKKALQGRIDALRKQVGKE